MIVGTVLVLASWVFFLGIVVILGYPIALILDRKSRTRNSLALLRQSMWIGLLVAVVAMLAIGIVFPLHSTQAGLSFAVVVVAIAALGLFLHQKRKQTTRIGLSQVTWIHWVFFLGLVASLIYLAAAALGPVTNYDSGLYHLGAIKYASDYATIPGLANLYFPFGYNTSLYPVAAFLGNGPWGDNGYRLANGFLIFLLSLEVFTRIITAKRGLKGLSVGALFLVVATPVVVIALVSLSDYWVTSPSSDAAVLVMTVVSVAYLLDALTTTRRFTINAGVSFVAAVIAFSLRPTMVVFLITLTLVLLLRLTRLPRQHRNLLRLVIPALLGIALLVVQSVRDYILSGWLQFPLSLFAFNVPWVAADPTWNRQPTLGNARNPADIWGSIDGFDWLGPYFSRLPNQWEFYLVLLLFAATLAAVALSAIFSTGIHWKTLTLAQIPIVASVITWFFFSPPTFRFGWGPVFSFFFVFLAFALKALIQGSSEPTRMNSVITGGTKYLLPLLGTALILIVGFNSLFRFQGEAINQAQSWSIGPLSVEYPIAPVIDVPVNEKTLDSGLTVLVPLESDQCWDNYPLCSPIISPSVSLRGDSITEGFLP